MRKLMIATLLIGAIACSDPETKATDAAGNETHYSDDSTLNSPRGTMSSDSTGGAGLDTSHSDTTNR
jgi:hypothetical protein